MRTFNIFMVLCLACLLFNACSSKKASETINGNGASETTINNSKTNKVSTPNNGESGMLIKTKISRQKIGAAPIKWPWRGITIISHDEEEITEEDIRIIAENDINFVRLRLSARRLAEEQNISEEAAVMQVLAWAEPVIEWCSKYNITTMLSMTEFPVKPEKGIKQTDASFWENEQELKKVKKHIKTIAEFGVTKGDDVAAYEYFPEPSMKNKLGKSIRPPRWPSFAAEIISIIRSVDSVRFISLTPGPWGPPMGYKDYEPYTDQNIVYNFHYYLPHAYTHQQTNKNKKEYTYPGQINTNYWDKEQMRKSISPAITWAKKHNKKYLFAGEFSVSRKAPGKDQYVKDLVDLFNEYNIGYAYFCYNGWDGWAIRDDLAESALNDSPSSRTTSMPNAQKQSLEKRAMSAKKRPKTESKEEMVNFLKKEWSKNKQNNKD